MAEQKGAAPPGASDTLAASGGLELPGGGAEGEAPPAEPHGKDRFPGEREADTAMPSQPGLVGTTGFGGDLPPTPVDATVDEALADERAHEGGGAAGQRRVR